MHEQLLHAVVAERHLRVRQDLANVRDARVRRAERWRRPRHRAP